MLSKALLLILLASPLLLQADPASSSCAPAAKVDACDPTACGGVQDAAQTISLRALAPESPDHYRKLAMLDGNARPEGGTLDRKQFALSAMAPAYLAILDVEPSYLRVPPTAFALPEFPANSSAQTRAELDHLLELQSRRTAEEIALSQQLAGVYYRLSVRPGDPDWTRMRQNLFHMGRQLGPWFSPDTLPVTADFMAKVWADASYYLWAAKFRHNRVRPWSLEPRLENLENANFPAYPSGEPGPSPTCADRDYRRGPFVPAHRPLRMTGGESPWISAQTPTPGNSNSRRDGNFVPPATARQMRTSCGRTPRLATLGSARMPPPAAGRRMASRRGRRRSSAPSPRALDHGGLRGSSGRTAARVRGLVTTRYFRTDPSSLSRPQEATCVRRTGSRSPFSQQHSSPSSPSPPDRSGDPRGSSRQEMSGEAL